MPNAKLTIGTRGSALALWQARHVIERLENVVPSLHVEVKQITTQGDRVRDRALSQVGGKGLFVKEIEAALLAGEIDLAVHSLKDMPTELPGGLALGAILARADARDALVARDGKSTLASLPLGSRIGTSSLRRRAQVLARRPDLKVVDLRGNVDTRLHKLDDGLCDGAVLAVAGLARLGYADRISEYLAVDVMIPAPGQGALCVEVRDDDAAIRTTIAPLDHMETHLATMAERAFLYRLEGGCRVPIGAYAEVNGNQIYLTGLVASPDGTRLVRDGIGGKTAQAARLGLELAERVLSAGGKAILEEVQRG
jgi:hydroxymethylbilane synthase